MDDRRDDTLDAQLADLQTQQKILDKNMKQARPDQKCSNDDDVYARVERTPQ